MNRTVHLNYDWQYISNFSEAYLKKDYDDSHFETVNIPHTNIDLPYNNFDEKLYQFESCYRKKIFIEATNKKIYVKFEGVMTYSKIYLNGIYLGEHKGGYTPFRIEITDAVVYDSENVLAVYVDSRERSDIPPFGFVIDYLTYGGIYREVSLEYRDEIHLEHILIKPRDVLTSPLLDIDLYFYNETKSKVVIDFNLKFKHAMVKSFQREIDLTELHQMVTITEAVNDIHLWDTDTPNLYDLEIKLLHDASQDQHNVRFGFRKAVFKEDGFYLNNKKIKLRGLNRHQSFPYVGYAMPKSAHEKDAEILKYDLGVNIVRLSHYPQSNHFMNKCDELGLLVFDEIPGWQHIGDEKWQAIAIENVKEMIFKDVNHPSVIIWGVRINESQDHTEFYKATNAMAKGIDSTRQTGGVRCIMNSELLEDVYTYNDFVHTGKNAGLSTKRNVIKTDKPYLVTEYNGHMFPTKKFDDESHRLDHALRHLNVLDAAAADELISGSIGWCMFDYNTHKDFGSGDKICYHGVLDMFRIPKYAAYVYASQGKKPMMHVASSLNIGEYPGSLLKDIHIFTNCDYVEFYRNGEYIGSFKPTKKYKHISHPPIIINDFIGDSIEKNEFFSKRDAQIIKDLLTSISRKGYHLSLFEKLKAGRLFLKYKMSTKDAEDLYTKYFGGWGGSSTDYTFKGYLDNACLFTVNKSQVFKPKLVTVLDSDTLYNDITYDTTRLVIKLVDDFENDIIYANDVVTLSTEGPIEIIGPKNLALIGGSIGCWIKSTGTKGHGKIFVSSERYGKTELKLSVE